jgi:hypothetical protein
MDDELLSSLYHFLIGHRNPFCTYGDGHITLIYFFAVIRGRSGRWACQEKNWPLWLRRLPLPSYSQFNRRLKTPGVEALIRRVNTHFRDKLPGGNEKILDGKPLIIGGYSKDPDAAEGKVPDGWARGYKLHALVDQGSGNIDAFTVAPLNVAEPTTARDLIKPLDLSGVIVRGDSAYDSNPLYTVIAENGGRLIAPRKKPGTKLGHHRQHPDRVAAIKELESDPDALAQHRRRRNRIEQTFAHVTNLPCGIAPLPNFVRRLSRVRRWIAAKIALFHLHRYLTQNTAKVA